MITYLKRLSYFQLLLLSAGISLLFSFFAWLPNNPINVDGILYIQTSQAYQQGGWHAAFAIYPWPFFSVFAAWMNKLTGLELLDCFTLINALLQVLIVVTFIDLNKTLGGNATCQRWAAFVILIYPLLNSIRDYATRDSGYWAFGLIAVCCLIQCMKTPKWPYALSWGISMAIASLFRVEGVILLALAPLVIFCSSENWGIKGYRFFQANIILFSAAFIGAAFYHFHPSADSNHASRLIEIKEQLLSTIPHAWTKLNTDAALLGKAILDSTSIENGRLILIGGLTYLFLYATIAVIKPLYFLLGLYGQATGLIRNDHGQLTLLFWLLIINVIMLFIFTWERYFLATRYPVFMALLWMCWVPFALQVIAEAWSESKQKFAGGAWLWPLILLILACMAVGGLVRFGYSKSYVTHAGYWLNQHTEENTTLLTNSKEIYFYASTRLTNPVRAQHITLMTDEKSLDDDCHYDWIALRVNTNDAPSSALQQFMQTHTPTKEFVNKRHDEVLIYQGCQ